MRTLMLTTVAVAAMSTSAFAQAQAPRPATPTPTAPPAATVPARPAPAATTTPTTAARPFGALPTGAAVSAQAARTAADAQLASRKQNCEAKGAMYKWKPPHVIGDANPKGGFYTTNFNGGCGLMSLKEALATGAVTARGN